MMWITKVTLINMTKSLLIEAGQMSEEKEAAEKEFIEDGKWWKKHWEDRRKGHRKMLELLHKEARGLKGSLTS